MTIPLTQGKHATVDEEDYPQLIRYKWYCHKRGKYEYAARNQDGHTVLMQRQILVVPDGMRIDHKDRNGLNCTRSNLRITTPAQNQGNNRKGTGKSSIYKGVNWDNQTNRWRASIKAQTHTVYIGLYDSEEEAARAYDIKAREVFGSYSRPNFLEGTTL